MPDENVIMLINVYDRGGLSAVVIIEAFRARISSDCAA
jgi:hypothetical protein